MASNGVGPAAIYVRISQDRDEERSGVERQLKACRELARNLGWTIGQVFEDNDLSAYRGKPRPAYERLLADLQAGRWRRLVVLHPDRLYRRAVELERLIPILEGVEVRTVRAGDIDLSTATGRQTARIIGATNQGESERQAERIRAKMAELLSNGEWKGGPRPFGWQADGINENKVEIRLLREAKDRILRGESLRSIVLDWQRRGIRSPRGKEIQPTTLKKMLTSPRMVGQYAKRDGTIIGAGKWKAIITAEEWARLRGILLDGSRNTRSRREPRKYLLVGLLRCGVCGAVMYGRPAFGGRPTPYYGCKKMVGYGGCGKVHIRVPVADELVERSVVELLDSQEFATRRARLLNEAPDVADALRTVTEIQGRMTELAASFGAGEISKAEWLTARRKLEPRLDVAQNDLARAEQSLGLALAEVDARELAAEWDELPFDRRRSVLTMLISRIEVRPHRGPQRQLDPDRISIIWRV